MKRHNRSNRLILGFFAMLSLVILMTLPASAYSYHLYSWPNEHTGFAMDSSVPSYWEDDLEDAMEEWTNAPSDFYYEWDSNSDNLFVCKDLPGETWNGRCSTWFSGNDITKTIITFNTDKSWSTAPSCPDGFMDVQSTATHELGHALALGHSWVNGATMWRYGYTGTIWKRSIESDDEDGIVAVYGT